MAKDVAETLGFTHVPKANALCPSRVVLKKSEVCTAKVQTLFDSKTQPSVTLIPESDVCRLVMRSNLPSAQAFQDWVCGTVLPAIRKDGAYIMGEEKGINGK